jgi:Mn-dependent DtxR family transcriptional regulator
MAIDAKVLRAMWQLAQRRQAASLSAVAVRAGARAEAVRAALQRLDALGLIDLGGARTARLTMAGLAVAVTLTPRKRSQTRERPARVDASRAA